MDDHFDKFIRAKVMATNYSGQKLVHLQATGADGIEFWTDENSLIDQTLFMEKRFRWHDLIKDPGDLPFRLKEDESAMAQVFAIVVIWIRDAYFAKYEVTLYSKDHGWTIEVGEKHKKHPRKVIAWKEIDDYNGGERIYEISELMNVGTTLREEEHRS